MEFSVSTTIEVDKTANGLAVRIPVPIELVYKKGVWIGRCENPAVETFAFDAMEEAMITCVEEVIREMDEESFDPCIIGRITPDIFASQPTLLPVRL